MTQSDLISLLRDARRNLKDDSHSTRDRLNFALEWLLDYTRRPKWKKNPRDESHERAEYGDFDCHAWPEVTAEPIHYNWLVLENGELLQGGEAVSMEKAKTLSETYVLKITSGDE